MDLQIQGIWWLWWMLGTFGVIGTGLLLWFAPTVLVQIVKVALTFFITSRVGNIIAAAAIAFFIADVNRSIRDEHEYAQKTAQFEQAQKERDDRIAQETREDVWKGIADATATNAEIDKEVKDVETAIVPTSDHPDSNLVGADSCRLRALAGQAGCGPQSTPRVPKAGTQAKPVGNHRRFQLPGSVRRILGRDQKRTDVHKGS